MRLSRLIGASCALLAAGLTADPASAFDERNALVVIGNHGDEDLALAHQLRSRLRRFARDVWVRGGRDGEVVSFTLLTETDLDRTADHLPAHADRLWKDNTIAVMVGTIARERGRYLPQGTIYLGRRVVASLPRRRENWFDEVRGRFQPGTDGEQAELALYEVIIGYALLRWAWQETRPGLVGAVAQVLRDRIQRARGQPGWSDCFLRIELATRAILHAPLPAAGSVRTVAREPQLEPVACE